jgi:hypothetical protein
MWVKLRMICYNLNALPSRLMVGHVPLEDGIGVRIPARQQARAPLSDHGLHLALTNFLKYLML